MTNHPYPAHVIERVAKGLWNTTPASGALDWEDLQPEDSINRKDVYLEKANAALQALWDASRIDTIQQLKKVPDFSILVDNEGFEYKAYEIRNPNIFPAHVLYWGDANGA